MSSIHQSCPECGRLLELPDGAAGKSARCPACQAVFRVADAEVSHDAPGSTVDASVGSDTPAARETPDPFPSRATASDVGSSAATAADAPTPLNPYQATTHGESSVECGPYTIVDRSIEPIVSSTWAIFTNRFAPVILSMLIVIAVGAVVAGLLMGTVFAGFMLADNRAAGGVLTAFGFILLLPVLVLLMAYLQVGMVRVMLAVARGQDSPLSEMTPPLKILGRVILGGFVLFLIFIPLFAAIGVVAGGIQAAGGDGLVAQIIGSVISSLMGAVTQFFMWPWLAAVSDGKSTALGSIRDSFVIAMHNKVTTLLIVICSFALSIAGTLTCYVGNIVTYPLSMLLFAVGYLMITNQPISDPRQPTSTTPASLNPTTV